MAQTHVVQPGDCITSIAYTYGWTSPQALYAHSDNADLRKARPDPNILFPGDVVQIPDAPPKRATATTDKSHRFQVSFARKKVRVVLIDADGQPFANLGYTFEVEGAAKRSGTTDGAGAVEESVRPDVHQATLTVASLGIARVLQIGYVDPVGTESGFYSRLDNLGFSCDDAGVRAFQAAHGIDPDGDPELASTRQKLVGRHGC